MKRLSVIIMALSAIVVMSSFVFMKNDMETVGLRELWKKYEKAENEDRIRDMADILESIKAEALKEKASWDYFRACDEYVNVKSRHNWKLTESLIASAAAELRDYGNPLLEVMFALNHGTPADSVVRMIESGAGLLKDSVSSDVYEEAKLFRHPRAEGFNELMAESIKDDYEFALWELLYKRGYECVWGYDELVKHLGNEYPAVPYVKYLRVMNGPYGSSRIKDMKALAEEYAGTAMGMLMEDEIFSLRFLDMAAENTSSDEFKNLKSEIEAFLKKVRSLKGEERTVGELCMKALGVLNDMETVDAAFHIEDGRARLVLRNLEKAKVRILKGDRVVYETVAVNETCSFYRPDTLEVKIPVPDDGDYTIKVIDVEGKYDLFESGYYKFTVSLARRTASDGLRIYAADYLSGKPVGKADIVLYDYDKNEVARSEDFVFDGFTSLPEVLRDSMKKEGTYYLECVYEKDGMVHRSRKASVRSSGGIVHEEPEPAVSSVILKDRGAFVPGDTLKFKAILYETGADDVMRTLPQGCEVVVKLVDPKGDELEKVRLVTNGFGSVSGGFAIDGSGRNGTHQIVVSFGEKVVGVSMLKVDEFVLPTYDVIFDPSEEVFLPGDEVKVRGHVKNYSGHGFGGLDAVASVVVRGRVLPEIPVALGSDGAFELSFTAGDRSNDYVGYDIALKLTDNTGETLEFSHSASVRRYMSLRAELLNGDKGEFTLSDKKSFRGVSDEIFSEEVARLRCWVDATKSGISDISISYELKCGVRTVREGTVMSGDVMELDMKGLDSGLYLLEMKAAVERPAGNGIEMGETVELLYLREGVKTLPGEVDMMFRVVGKDGISVQFGSGTGTLWAVVQLFGEGDVPLRQEVLRSAAGSVTTVSYGYPDRYSDNVLLSVFCFRDGGSRCFNHVFARLEEKSALPLELVSFSDRMLPGQDCAIIMKTRPDAEVAAAVFDVSSEKVYRNRWNRVHKKNPAPYVYISSTAGCDEGGNENLWRFYPGYSDSEVLGYGEAENIKMMKVTGSANSMMSFAEDAVEDAVPAMTSRESDEAVQEAGSIAVRDDFSTTLAFEPFLMPSADGRVELRFRTSGKLSTFKLQVYAHDRSMDNSLISGEMLVTIPLKTAVVQPQYLYAGDRYVFNVSLSNAIESDLKGSVVFEIYDGKEFRDVKPLKIYSAEVLVPGGSSTAVAFDVDVPEGVDSLGFKVVFAGHEYSDDPAVAVNEALVSDGMFVSVPVYPDAQVLAEAHSAVLLGGRPADGQMERLRKEFVNVSPVGAECSEVSIMDMIREALPDAYEAEGKDAVSQSEAMYVNFMAADLHAGDSAVVRKCVDSAMSAVSRLLACVNPDGGFGWFEGMPSSPLVTALVLERYAGLSDRRLLDVAQSVWGEDSLDDLDCAVRPAVKYLDSVCFAESERPLWYGRLSLGQYLAVRSKFAGIEFDEDAARKTVGRKKYREFQKEVREFLMPKETGTSGDILAKVRTVRVIIDLLDGSPSGHRLCGAWGISSTSDVRKMVKCRDRELKSLKQYAVEHPSGGIYYPNAVMPWRGLLESEAYAHAQICDLFREVADSYYGDWSLDKIADMICVWLMLQKETQEWSSDPGFVEALASVYDGSEAVRDTRILILKKRYMKPFEEIRAAGNGFDVTVDYYKSGPDGLRARLADGDSLHVGDKITAVYSLWSEENRSHVRLSVPRAACFRPVEQLSGWSGGWFRPLSYGTASVSPYSYREVKADRTLWWIDVFPEEKTMIEEELFVTQEGAFTAPVAEIESVYAPHYRANDSWHGILEISK